MELYTRKGSASLKKEASANTAITPDTFFDLLSEDIAANYQYTPAVPVCGIRAMNRRAIDGAIPAPAGNLSVNVEHTNFGHFLNGIFGGLTSGVKFVFNNVTNLSVGDTITNGSTGTATVAAILEHDLTVLCTGSSGDWATGNTVTNGATFSATLGTFSATVYGHTGKCPVDLDVTYSLQINYSESAIRYTGVRFYGIDSLTPADNVMTANIKVMAQGQFRQGRINATITAGSGAKTITLDQTHGLVAGDSIKVYRQGTGFLAFASAGVYTHTIGSVSDDVSISVTNLQTELLDGDLILLAPQTPSCPTNKEFTWTGGGQISVGATIGAVSDYNVEEFSFNIDNELEERHAGHGTNINDRFPSAILQKSNMGSGSFMVYYQNENFISKARLNTAQALKLALTGGQIAATGLYYGLSVKYPEVQFDAYDTNIETDALVNENIPFTAFYNNTEGYLAEVLLTNTTASY